MELFDFAKLIGGFIHFSGSFDPNNTYINASLQVRYDDVSENGTSIFGRTTGNEVPGYSLTGDGLHLDSALLSLADGLRGKRIRCQDGSTYTHYNVPDDLTHSWGYRGPKNKPKRK